MALKTQSSFAAGEIDPALRERTDLDRYRIGLAKQLNLVVGKTGRAISMPGSNFQFTTKSDNERVAFYVHPSPTGGPDVILEFGHNYLRNKSSAGEIVTTFTRDMLPSLRCFSVKESVYVFCAGQFMRKYAVTPSSLAVDNTPFDSNPLATIPQLHEGGTGLNVDYAITAIVKGEEFAPTYSLTNIKSVINTGEQNEIDVRANLPKAPDEIRVFRRFYTGGSVGAFGYIGSIVNFTQNAGPPVYFTGSFIDRGQTPDYEQSPPSMSYLDDNVNDPTDAKGRTGIFYGQRLIITRADNEEVLEASRPGFPKNFLRDYPLVASSALTFKCGSAGSARILHLMDNDGLIAFTTRGVYVNQGALTPNNINMDKKADYVCDVNLPPLALPGAILFRDIKTNTIRALLWDENAKSYIGEEVSIFSDHLFRSRLIVSWAFVMGEIPLVYVVFDDGKCASFAYQREHEMKSWGQMEFYLPAEHVFAGTNGEAYFCLFDASTGKRHVIKLASRNVEKRLPTSYTARKGVDPFYFFCGLHNAYSMPPVLLNTNAAVYTIAPVSPGVWDDELTISKTGGDIFNGTYVGLIYRVYDARGNGFDMQVISVESGTSITVKMVDGIPFPQSEANNPEIWRTYDSVTVAGQWWGSRKVAVVGDAKLLGVEMDPTGAIALPERATHIHVGIPFTYDLETLDINTVEQRPVFMESKNVNKLYVAVMNSRTFYCGNTFGPVEGQDAMVEVGLMHVTPIEEEIEVQRGPRLRTRRYEILLPGDWGSNGRICIRGFGHEPIEILSIIPDMDELARGR